jgi:HlyD family secretion protein
MAARSARAWRNGGVWLAAVGVAGLIAVGLRPWAGDTATTSFESEEIVLVPVEEGHLTARVVTRGDVTPRNPTAILVTQPPPDRDPVLTRVPSVGTHVAEGDVLYELAGRPIFVLEGTIPAYRDLAPGDSGQDVEGLQGALKRLGLYAGTLDGEYGVATAGALQKLYTAHGYTPPQAPAETRDRLEALLQQRDELDGAVTNDDGNSGDLRLNRERAGVDSDISSVRQAVATPFVRREFVYVPALPVVVQTVDQAAGSVAEPQSPLLTVSSGQVGVEVAFLEPGFDRFIGRDAELELDAASSSPAHGVVTGRDVDQKGEPTLVVSSEALTLDHIGRNVKVSIVDRAVAEVTLLVPVSAVVTTGTGGSYVDKKQTDGSLARVEVKVIDEADGTVALRPRKIHELAPGDLVRLAEP